MKRLLAVASVPALAFLIGHVVPVSAAPEKSPPDDAETSQSLDGAIPADPLLIAKGGNGQSSLWVECSNERHVRLRLNTRLPIDEQFARNGTFSDFHMEIRILRENMRTTANIKSSPRLLFDSATWRRNDESDVLFTPPLSANDIQTLVRSFAAVPPAVVRVDAAETGTEMAGAVDGKAIAGFANRCEGDIGL